MHSSAARSTAIRTSSPASLRSHSGSASSPTRAVLSASEPPPSRKLTRPSSASIASMPRSRSRSYANDASSSRPTSTSSFPAITISGFAAPLATNRNRGANPPPSPATGKYRWCDCIAVIGTRGGSSR